MNGEFIEVPLYLTNHLHFMKRYLLTTILFSFLTLGSTAQTERGFRHPGGLYTQDDFDRVKQQIADGNSRVIAAHNVLKSAAYAQSSAGTSPVETIVRGGGSGENYINAARGATIAFQNALRWKIEGNKACANHAVDVLMRWCNTTKAVTGNSDQCLAYGLYGYQFAQAAELMRDYEGWKPEDFQAFQRWMLDVWYPGCIGFLRGRNGTWENSGKWWQAPGHYWSNWGLCNAMALLSIGVLCDDVFIYNQGLSFIKYDQVGTFKDPRTENPIKNDGLTEFWGNLIVTTTEWDGETGAYGKVGQMNESGRDTGHSAMALGLAVDIARQAWNQGDDLFAYMDHRLAAGIEYVAAQCQSVENLPWTNYHYGSSGYYYSDSRAWLMTGPAVGAQIRPYWATVTGIYEGVKGVKMPFAEKCLDDMGIDAGGQGSTSGGYDHLGYSVLMNTFGENNTNGKYLNPNPPTELTPQIKSGTRTINHNELGGLTNTYQTTAVNNRAVAPGTVLTLSPCLPEGETDTNQWLWNTGETTREITITANQSYIYRVAYTNQQGAKSELCFSIAVQGDCHDCKIVPSITYAGKATETDVIVVKSGSSVTLSISTREGFGNYLWENGRTSQSITLTNIKESQTVRGCFQNQGGRQTWQTFHIYVNDYETDPDRTVEAGNYRIHHIPTDTYLTNNGDSVDFSPLSGDGSRQIWSIDRPLSGKTNFMSLSDSLFMNKTGAMVKVKTRPHRILFAQGTDYCTFANTDNQYWYINDDQNLVLGQQTILFEYPFELLPVTDDELTPIDAISDQDSSQLTYYTLSGMRIDRPQRGVTIVKDSNGKTYKTYIQE